MLPVISGRINTSKTPENKPWQNPEYGSVVFDADKKVRFSLWKERIIFRFRGHNWWHCQEEFQAPDWSFRVTGTGRISLPEVQWKFHMVVLHRGSYFRRYPEVKYPVHRKLDAFSRMVICIWQREHIIYQEDIRVLLFYDWKKMFLFFRICLFMAEIPDRITARGAKLMGGSSDKFGLFLPAFSGSDHSSGKEPGTDTQSQNCQKSCAGECKSL